MPRTLSTRARIAPVNEPGEPMLVTGRVIDADGKPRHGVIVYAYHTDNHGIYPRPARSPGSASDRHGRLRGWAISDAEGRYAFETIRPGSYPSRDALAHIHMHVIERGCATYYIDEIVFSDDPLMTPEQQRRHQTNRAGNGITHPRRDEASGRWEVTRDIHLGLNIPGYRRCERSDTASSN